MTTTSSVVTTLPLFAWSATQQPSDKGEAVQRPAQMAQKLMTAADCGLTHVAEEADKDFSRKKGRPGFD